MSKIYTLDAWTVSIDSERVLRALGYPTKETASNKVKDELPQLTKDVINHVKTKAIVVLRHL